MYRFFFLFILAVASLGVFVYTQPATITSETELAQEEPSFVNVNIKPEPKADEPSTQAQETPIVSVLPSKEPPIIIAPADKAPQLIEVATPPKQAALIEEPALPTSASYSTNSLTQVGIVTWTNMFRASNNLPTLFYNSELSKAATIKANDILTQQYFEHTSPDGISAGDLAKDQGYEYITVGENLALGTYKNDEALVQAWMDSAGHRKNILNTSYEEIGTGVARGIYEGSERWVAVQIFGRPLSSCTSPDTDLKAKVDLYTEQIDQIEITIDVLKNDIDTNTPPYNQEYRNKIDEYNILAKFTNGLIGELKGFVNVYNTQVANFNTCAVS